MAPKTITLLACSAQAFAAQTSPTTLALPSSAAPAAIKIERCFIALARARGLWQARLQLKPIGSEWALRFAI